MPLSSNNIIVYHEHNVFAQNVFILFRMCQNKNIIIKEFSHLDNVMYD